MLCLFMVLVTDLLHSSAQPAQGIIVTPDMTRSLERLREHVEEWGIVTVSEPLILEDANAFSLGDGFLTAKDYIELARKGVQGTISQSSSSYIGSATNVSVGLPTPDSSPAGLSNAPTGTPTPIPTPDLKSSDNYAISSRKAILIGINDKITEELLRRMAEPDVSNTYLVHFAIVQFSVNPGWRTQENYIADCSATCSYVRPGSFSDGKSIAGENSDEGDPMRNVQQEDESPMVFSVLPLLDAQTLELGNIDQTMVELVGKLVAQYPSTSGKIDLNSLAKFVRSFQRSATSRTPITVENSYSAGSTFGFRIAPSFVALSDPASRRSGTANRLIATSFPVMVTLVHHLDPTARKTGKLPKVMVDVTSRWLIYQRPRFTRWMARLGLPLKRESEQMRIDLSAEFETLNQKVLEHIKERELQPRGWGEDSLTFLRDFADLKQKVMDQTRILLSPPSPKSEASSKANIGEVNPYDLKDKMIVKFSGKGLADPLVATLGDYAAERIYRLSKTQYIAVFPTVKVPDKKPTIEMKVYLKGKDEPLTFDVDLTNEQPQTAPSPIETPAPSPAGANPK